MPVHGAARVADLGSGLALKEPMQSFSIEVSGRTVPGVYWLPSGAVRGVLLACHGGSGHKLSGAITAIVEEALPKGFAVVAIDGPVQGERRSDGLLDKVSAITSFRQAWKEGVGRLSMAEDMTAALEHVIALEDLGGKPVCYIGVSMGTAYGVPLLAGSDRFAAAVIGLWSCGHVASEHLAGFANQISVPVCFTMQWEDEVFNRQSTIELYEAIGSANKRLVAYPGPHRELEGQRLKESMAFLAQYLA